MDRNYPSTGVHRLNATTRSFTRGSQIDSRNGSQVLGLALIAIVTLGFAFSSPGRDQREKWAATWASSMQGTLAVGPAAPYGDTPASVYGTQPDLTFALPNGTVDGAVDQTIRLIVKPDIWGRWARLRFSNFFGSQPVTFAKVTVALQSYAANLVADSSTVVTFNGKSSVTIQPGERIFSDPVRLRFVPEGDAEKHRTVSLAGRNLAVSFAVQGKTGPMTSHNGAYHTSYISPSGSGDHTGDLTGANYPYSTTSWFFLDAIDVLAPADTVVICAFGDSITDGQFSTINGNDRWPNAFSDRIHAVFGDRVSVVNEGIAGNTVVNPAQIGPAAVDRLDRDVLSLSGLTAVIWLEGINDFGAENNSASAVIAGLTDGINRMHAQGIKVIGATITSSLGCTLLPNWGTIVTDGKRKTTNDFIRHSGLYDSIADMDAATLDSSTGQLRPEFVPDSAKGGPGDLLHPNRAGYQAMANTVDLKGLAPR